MKNTVRSGLPFGLQEELQEEAMEVQNAIGQQAQAGEIPVHIRPHARLPAWLPGCPVAWFGWSPCRLACWLPPSSPFLGSLALLWMHGWLCVWLLPHAEAVSVYRIACLLSLCVSCAARLFGPG